MHSFDVHLQFLGLTKLSATKVTERPSALRVGSAAVRAVHVQVVEAEEELQSDNNATRSQHVDTRPDTDDVSCVRVNSVGNRS